MTTSTATIIGEARLSHLRMIATHCANLRLMVQVVPMVEHIDALVLKIKEVQPGLLAAELANQAPSLGGQSSGVKAADEPQPSRKQLLDELIAVSAKAAAESRALEAKTARASASLHDAISWLDKSMRNIHEVLVALANNPAACASERVTGLIAPLTGLKTAAFELQAAAQKEAGAAAIRPYRFWTNAGYALAAVLVLYIALGMFFHIINSAPLTLAGDIFLGGFFALLVAAVVCFTRSDKYQRDCGWAAEVTSTGKLPEYLEREEVIANDALALVATTRELAAELPATTA